MLFKFVVCLCWFVFTCSQGVCGCMSLVEWYLLMVFEWLVYGSLMVRVMVDALTSNTLDLHKALIIKSQYKYKEEKMKDIMNISLKFYLN